MYPQWIEKDEEERTFHFTPKKIITGGFIVLTLVVAVGIVIAVQKPEFFNLEPNENFFSRYGKKVYFLIVNNKEDTFFEIPEL